MAEQRIQRRSMIANGRRGMLAGMALAALMLAVAAPGHSAESRAVRSRVQPIYPEIAKRMHISGVVKVAATVAADGSVTAVKTVTGNTMLGHAAEDAVSKWKFVPGDAETVDVDINFAAAD